MNWDFTNDSRIEIVDSVTIQGYRFSDGWARDQHIYFRTRFSKPFTSVQIDTTAIIKDGKHIGTAAIARFDFNTKKGEQIIVSTAISGVSMQGAERNLSAEVPDNDFDKYRNAIRDNWNRQLSKIKVESSNNDDKVNFYTALYHSMIAPTIYSDVDGAYYGPDKQIHQTNGWVNYSTFSLWDTFRAAHPLFTYTEPERANDMVKSFLAFYEQNGRLPVWNFYGSETDMMIGYHAVSVIADAMMKKQCDFDVKKALEACIRSSVYDTTGVTPMMDRQILNGKLMPVSIKYKNELGYIPCDKVGGSVSQGLEFAYNDWLIAQMMKEHNRKDLYDKYMELSRNYRNYFDPETKLMRGRLSDGSWITPFDPASVQRPSNYVEGNAWQWAWFVPQDVEGLMELVGGQKSFEAHLDTLFTTSSELTGDPNAAADVTGMIGQYAHGNEPSHHIPYLYNYAGAPRKTQALVDHILRTLYHNDPNGLSGNEDVGQMSAWYALSAMGFYSFCPGRPVYEIGRPIFDKVTIHLSNGKDFVIQAKNNSVENKYIRSMKLNGEDLAEPRFSHFDLMKGGELIFEMEN